MDFVPAKFNQLKFRPSPHLISATWVIGWRGSKTQQILAWKDENTPEGLSQMLNDTFTLRSSSLPYSLGFHNQQQQCNNDIKIYYHHHFPWFHACLIVLGAFSSVQVKICWVRLSRHQITDVEVIKSGEGRNFKWLNFCRDKIQGLSNSGTKF